MFEELDAIPWSWLRHNYGSARDVPELLRRCTDPDHQIAAAAIDQLHVSLFHQGGWICPAATAALPFLVTLAMSSSSGRSEALSLVTDLAEEATRVQPRHLDPGWPDALAAVSSDLVSLLDDVDPAVRRAASRLVAVGGFDHQLTLAAVARRWGVETDAVTKLDLILALGHLMARDRSNASDVIALVRGLADDGELQTRLAAVIALAGIDAGAVGSRIDDLIDAVTDGSVTVWKDSDWIGGGAAAVIWTVGELLVDDPLLGASFAIKVGARGDANHRLASLAQAADLLATTRVVEPLFLPVLADQLADQHPGVRFRAAYLLGCLGRAAIAHADDLAALIEDSGPVGCGHTVADAALWAVARQRDPRCRPELRRRLVGDRLGYPSASIYHMQGPHFFLPGIHEVLAASEAADELVDAIAARLRRAYAAGDLELVNVLCHTLGANAEPVVPLLHDILRSSPERRAPEFAVLEAIGRIGPPALATAPELARRAAHGSADAALALWKVTGTCQPV